VTPIIEVVASLGSPVLTIETAPLHEEAFFKTLKGTAGRDTASYTLATAGAVGGEVFDWENCSAGDVPPSRWLRWKLTAAVGWAAVFRIWLNLRQGRGGAFALARLPLPTCGRSQPNDHAHRAQPRLRQIAERDSRWGAGATGGGVTWQRPAALRWEVTLPADFRRQHLPLGSTQHALITDPDDFLAGIRQLGDRELLADVESEIHHLMRIAVPAGEDDE
jgi:hypothetical protein